MRVLLLVVLFVLFVAASASGEVVFTAADRRGDDWGSGELEYPTDPLFKAGLFDLTNFKVGMGEGFYWFDLAFRELTNPFNAPEGYFHQRMEVYIDTGDGPGSAQVKLGNEVFTLAEGSWQVRISGAPFGETRVYKWEAGRLREFTQGIGSYLLDDGLTVRIAVPQDLLAPPAKHWRYVVLIGGFDSLAPDNWRQAVPYSDQWQFRGNTAVADLLDPWWSWPRQRRQLGERMLYPIPGRKNPMLLFAVGVGGAVLAVGTAVVMRRWKHA